MRRPRPALRVRPLEGRDAPATLVSAHAVTYQDADGDTVTVRVSRPVFDAATVNAVLTFNSGPGAVNGSNAVREQLQTVDFGKLADPAAAAGTNLTVTATRRHGGDGLANVGAVGA